jgi:hypothetical protein
MKDSWHENAEALKAARPQLILQSWRIQNVYSMLTRSDARPERIERRLGLIEVA